MRKMKKYRKTGAIVLLVIALGLAFSGCRKDKEDSALIKEGSWSGTDISFVVTGNPQRVEDLEFTYSGHATGNICSYDYNSGASFATVAAINQMLFAVQLSTFDIQGTFLTDSTAQIEISWEAYDIACDANYSGSHTYSASFVTDN